MTKRLSVIICVYDMQREAARTLLSACAPYQENVDPADYEIIVVDNGSPTPLQIEGGYGAPEIHLIRIYRPSPSPVAAINHAVRNFASGENLLIAIDGARIFSCGLIAEVITALKLGHSPFVYTISCHLGPKVQMQSRLEGYNQAIEDQLIEQSGWPARKDALFDCCVLAGSSQHGLFHCVAESNAFAMPRQLYESIGGYDERFCSPGGGLCNLEFFRRITTRPQAFNICLLSETTFHQIHGGAATSCSVSPSIFFDEYRTIFGCDFAVADYSFILHGAVRETASRLLEMSLPRKGNAEKNGVP